LGLTVRFMVTRFPAHRPPTHPGEILDEEFVRPLEIDPAAFATTIGMSLDQFNELVEGKRGVTPEMAEELGRVLDMSPAFWLNLQHDCDRWQLKSQR
jgi:addiction module HigA family antidote